MHIEIRSDIKNILFIEKFEFLVQTMVLYVDDELISYLIRFYKSISDNFKNKDMLTDIHDIFKGSKDQAADYLLN